MLVHFLALKNGDGAYIAFYRLLCAVFAVTWAVFMRRHPGRIEGV